jgi:N-acetylglutamate synthase-like GNAT family acetyltransferase
MLYPKITSAKIIENYTLLVNFSNTLSLLCALKGLHIGSSLLEAVNEYAIKNNFNTLTLLALPDKKLIEWYKKQGFKEGKNDFGNIKCVEMYKIVS